MNSFKVIVVFISAIIVAVIYLVACFEVIDFPALPNWANVILRILFAFYTPFVFKGFITEMLTVLKVKPEKEIN